MMFVGFVEESVSLSVMVKRLQPRRLTLFIIILVRLPSVSAGVESCLVRAPSRSIKSLSFYLRSRMKGREVGGRVWCVCRKAKLSRRLALKIIVLLTHSYECELSVVCHQFTCTKSHCSCLFISYTYLKIHPRRTPCRGGRHRSKGVSDDIHGLVV